MSLSTPLLRLLAGWVLSAVLVLAPEGAHAQEEEDRCWVNDATPSINFGLVNRAGGTSKGELDLRCQGTYAGTLYFTICIFLGPGGNGGIEPRLLKQYWPEDFLQYDLYSDPNHLNLLGPKESGHAVYQVHLEVPADTQGHMYVDVYGLVHPGQAALPGDYEEWNLQGDLYYQFSPTNYPDTFDCTGPEGGHRTFNSGRMHAQFEDSCIVSASDLDFGQVTTLGQSVPGESIIRVDCPAGKEWSLGLDNGQNHASGNRRMMESGGRYVHYGLYIDPARTRAWGDTDAEDRYAGATDGSASPVEVTVYGEVPAQDDVPPGRYTDTVIATLYY